MDFNFSSCKLLFVFCIILIIIIITIIYINNNKVFILEGDNESTLIKKSPTTFVINMDEPKPIEYTITNVNPFDEQLLKLHKPDIQIGQNLISKQELEEKTIDEYEVQKVKPYTPLKAQKKMKLSKTDCNLSSNSNCNNL